MTSIAWDGHTLAADTRKTQRRLNHRIDVAVKLHSFQRELYVQHKKTLECHRVMACAGAGYSAGITRAVWMLEQDPTAFLPFHKQLHESGLDSPERTFSLIFIADCLPFTFRAGKSYLTGPKLSDPTHRVSSGSGGKVAKWLMETYNIPAHLAVAGASLHDPGTGGVIHALSFDKERIAKREQFYFTDRREIEREIQTHIGRHRVPAEAQLAVDSMFVAEPEASRIQWTLTDKPQSSLE